MVMIRNGTIQRDTSDVIWALSRLKLPAPRMFVQQLV